MKTCLFVLLAIFSLAGASHSRVMQDAIEKVKQKAGLRHDWDPSLKEIPKGANYFTIAGRVVHLGDLVPAQDLFTDDAEILIDGVRQPPKTLLYKSRVHRGVTVILDDKKDLIKASLTLPNGDEIDLIHLSGSTFAEVDADKDIDLSQFTDFEISGALTEGLPSARNLRGRGVARRRLAQISPPSPICTNLAQATIYFAADSDFVADAIAECDTCDVPDGEKALAAIEEVFAEVQALYREELCIDLSIKGVDIRTNQSNDPYRNLRLASSEVCGSSGFLWDLTVWLLQPGNDPSGGDRNIFHLLYGDPDASGIRTLGCGWIGQTCNKYYAVSLSEMSYKGVYSANMRTKRNLLAHELGHNFGADHETQIMQGSLGEAASFSLFSVGEIQNCVNVLPGTTCQNWCMDVVPYTPLEEPTTTTAATTTTSTTTTTTTTPTTTTSTTTTPTTTTTTPTTTTSRTTTPTTTTPTTTTSTTTTPKATTTSATTTSTTTTPTTTTTTTTPTTTTTTPTTTTSTTTTPTTTTTSTSTTTTQAESSHPEILYFELINDATGEKLTTCYPGNRYVVEASVPKYTVRAVTSQGVEKVKWYMQGRFKGQDIAPAAFEYTPRIWKGSNFKISARPYIGATEGTEPIIWVKHNK